jgi:hypothetical protein
VPGHVTITDEGTFASTYEETAPRERHEYVVVRTRLAIPSDLERERAAPACAHANRLANRPAVHDPAFDRCRCDAQVAKDLLDVGQVGDRRPPRSVVDLLHLNTGQQSRTVGDRNRSVVRELEAAAPHSGELCQL